MKSTSANFHLTVQGPPIFLSPKGLDFLPLDLYWLESHYPLFHREAFPSHEVKKNRRLRDCLQIERTTKGSGSREKKQEDYIE